MYRLKALWKNLTEPRLSEGQLQAAEKGKFNLAIIDTPPAAGAQAYTAAQAADRRGESG